MARKSKTASYYASNPEAYKKKLEYDKKRNSTKKQKDYRAELARERRARGIMGKGGPDVSHTQGGGYVLENASTNRARNGHGGKPRLSSAKGSKKSKR